MAGTRHPRVGTGTAPGPRRPAGMSFSTTGRRPARVAAIRGSPIPFAGMSAAVGPAMALLGRERTVMGGVVAAPHRTSR